MWWTPFLLSVKVGSHRIHKQEPTRFGRFWVVRSLVNVGKFSSELCSVFGGVQEEIAPRFLGIVGKGVDTDNHNPVFLFFLFVVIILITFLLLAAFLHGVQDKGNVSNLVVSLHPHNLTDGVGQHFCLPMGEVLVGVVLLVWIPEHLGYVGGGLGDDGGNHQVRSRCSTNGKR